MTFKITQRHRLLHYWKANVFMDLLLTVVEVQLDAWERRPPTSNLQLRTSPHLKYPKDAGDSKGNAISLQPYIIICYFNLGHDYCAS